ncbi:swr1 complex component [Cladochytrium tenue]|nr:swr1 complex component [Cladochytrium tenue]
MMHTRSVKRRRLLSGEAIESVSDEASDVDEADRDTSTGVDGGVTTANETRLETEPSRRRSSRLGSGTVALSETAVLDASSDDAPAIGRGSLRSNMLSNSRPPSRRASTSVTPRQQRSPPPISPTRRDSLPGSSARGRSGRGGGRGRVAGHPSLVPEPVAALQQAAASHRASPRLSAASRAQVLSASHSRRSSEHEKSRSKSSSPSLIPEESGDARIDATYSLRSTLGKRSARSVKPERSSEASPTPVPSSPSATLPVPHESLSLEPARTASPSLTTRQTTPNPVPDGNLSFKLLGGLPGYLSSFVWLDDDLLPSGSPLINARAETEARFRHRVHVFQSQGMLMGDRPLSHRGGVTGQPLSFSPAQGSGTSSGGGGRIGSRPLSFGTPLSQSSSQVASEEVLSSDSTPHWTRLLEDSRRLAGTLSTQRRTNISNARRVARAVQRFWEAKKTEGERLAKLEEKRVRKMAKWLAGEVAKKWKVVDIIVKGKLRQLQKMEHERAGRRQLQAILTQSTHILSSVAASSYLLPDGASPSQNGLAGSGDDDMSDKSSHFGTSDDEDASEAGRIENGEASLGELLGYSTAGTGVDLDRRRDRQRDSEPPDDESEDDFERAQPDDGGFGTANGSVQGADERASEANAVGSAEGGDFEFDDDAIEILPNRPSAFTSLTVRTDAPPTPATIISDKGQALSADIVEKPSAELQALTADQPLQENGHAGTNPTVQEAVQERADTMEVDADDNASDLMSTADSDLVEQPTGNTLNTTEIHVRGLGKTIQTIALIAYLAVEKAVWGPHLIVVPTSVILNWEFEFKKWCPGLKILTYYGSPNQRREKRSGWSKPNAFHVCITSYQLVLTDQQILRRRPWQYLILDEAHNIKNFRSQRWQVLLNFNAQRRLLLTGTPLQNNLMELWSLMYFLMPNGVSSAMPNGFATLKEFQEWFSRPVEQLVVDKGSSGEANGQIRETIEKLHTILRPYLLRRLKADVEKQMPGKFEQVVYCKLSLRQRFLYDEFMSRAKTREDLASGDYLSILNCLMQLRKVCNHPDLFETRPIVTSLALPGSVTEDFGDTAAVVWRLLQTPSRAALGSSGGWLASADSLRLNLRDWNLLVADEGKEHVSAIEATLVMEKDPDALFDDTIRTVLQAENLLQGSNPTPGGLSNILDHGNLMRVRHTAQTGSRWMRVQRLNRRRCAVRPIFGDRLMFLLRCLAAPPPHQAILDQRLPPPFAPSYDAFIPLAAQRAADSWDARLSPAVAEDLVKTLRARLDGPLKPLIARFAFVTPPARIVSRHGGLPIGPPAGLWSPTAPAPPSCLPLLRFSSTPPTTSNPTTAAELLRPVVAADPGFADCLHPARTRLSVAFPDQWLLQFDCGKLQALAGMLRELKAGGHRVLVFTQMARVLDILERFLNIHGYVYLRLDGATRVEDRKILMDRFNSDTRIFVFILSTRSGGVGMNLTGADTVIFYDRLISKHTIEENMLRKADEKRRLDSVVIRDGDFTADRLRRTDWRDWLDEDMAKLVDARGRESAPAALRDAGSGGALPTPSPPPPAPVLPPAAGEPGTLEGVAPAENGTSEATTTERHDLLAGDGKRGWEEAMMAVEDESDVAAMQSARHELALELVEFDEAAAAAAAAAAATAAATAAREGREAAAAAAADYVGHVDDYMLRFWVWNTGMPPAVLEMLQEAA